MNLVMVECDTKSEPCKSVTQHKVIDRNESFERCLVVELLNYITIIFSFIRGARSNGFLPSLSSFENSTNYSKYILILSQDS